MPILTGYEDTPGGHDALFLGARLARLTELRPVATTVYPTDGQGYVLAARDPRWRQKTEVVARDRFARARTMVGHEGFGAVAPEFSWLGPATVHTALAEHAEGIGASFLVVGSTGHGLGGGWPLAAPCSVCCRSPSARSPSRPAGTGTPDPAP